LYDLQPAFVVQSISQGSTDPNGGVSAPSTLVTCKTTKTGGGHMKDSGYPSRLATTTCTGLYEQRVISRAYWGSNTTIYFLGLTGFSIPGAWKISFVVTGLYYGNTITLTASAQLQVGSTASGAAPPSSQSPSASVVPTRPSISINGYSDFTVYVQDPNNPPVSGTFYDLQPAFIVQSISSSVTYPNGTVVNIGTFVTCTTAATNKYPGYPSNGATTACVGAYPARVDPRAYWGSNTAIYFISIGGFSAPGTRTVTFTVTGLYYSSTITVTASANITVS
jgi:hypothetical protein